MHKFRKIMLVTTAIGGIGLSGAGAGAAQAYGSDDEPSNAAVGNAQFLQCEQEFSSSLITVNAPVSVLGDSVTNIGNFCTQAAPDSGSR
ncbi:hypothetical protein ACF1HJ_02685 [Streptomyces sp. NPDC013978]|uniref:hypothetical protein n=1 Tax=Streptomyces sp. NPDC013978 TaxID=3364869 RepID=UPI0036FCE058